MGRVLNPLRLINSLLQHTKLDKKKAGDFPELLEVVKYHTHSKEFTIQFFKHPIIPQDCICKACSGGILKLVRMPQSIYNKVKEFPMPMLIPKARVLGDTDCHYMPFAEPQLFLFARSLPRG
jgi:hypothetical protein